MRLRRFILCVLMPVAVNCLLISPAAALFGFASDETGGIGLDLNRGYDVNTVTTVSGKVITAPRTISNEHVIVEIKSAAENISLSVGPTVYWGKKGIPLHANDYVIAKGSMAQGKDGKTYMLIQNLVNKTTGKKIVLRNDNGEPVWMGTDTGSMRSNGASGGSGNMRGSGGMMRNSGGGGMMRR